MAARVLILRQQPEAAETAEAIRARGHAPLVLPLAEALPTGAPPPNGAVGGFVLTSLQAVSALAAAFPRDPRPVLCTGERTRRALMDAGFPAAEAGGGTGGELAGRLAEIAAGTGLPLLYAAGRVRLPALERAAAARGARLVVWEVYDVRPVRPSQAAIAEVFEAGGPSHALVLSVGQAAGFSALWGAVGGDRAVPALLCLSDRIAEGLSADLRPFARISPQPTLSSLFDRHLPPSLG